MAQSISNNNQSTAVVTCDHCDKQCDKLYPSGGMDEICLGCYTKYCRPQEENECDEDYLTRLPFHSDMTMKKAHEHYYQILMRNKNPITYEEFESNLFKYLKKVMEDEEYEVRRDIRAEMERNIWSKMNEEERKEYFEKGDGSFKKQNKIYKKYAKKYNINWIEYPERKQ